MASYQFEVGSDYEYELQMVGGNCGCHGGDGDINQFDVGDFCDGDPKAGVVMAMIVTAFEWHCKR